MILISHRGNINGRIQELENRPDYIIQALNKGYDCECDVWKIGDKWWLGHDEPQYEIETSFFNLKGLWLHAKNYEALVSLILDFTNLNIFSHDKDPYTITTRGYIWAYPGEKIGPKTICVMPERANYSSINSDGICSDFIESYL